MSDKEFDWSDTGTHYSRDNFPPYTYKPLNAPPSKAGFIAVMAVCMICGMFAGVYGWQLFANKMEADRIAARTQAENIENMWEQHEVVIPAEYAILMQTSACYGTELWSSLDPVTNEDGSIVLSPESAGEMTQLAEALTADIDGLITEYSNPDVFPGFGQVSVDSTYQSLQVQTTMRQESLLDKTKINQLLERMKLHMLVYDPEKTVTISFVNEQDGSVVYIISS